MRFVTRIYLGAFCYQNISRCVSLPETRFSASWSPRPWPPSCPRTSTSSSRRLCPSASIWRGTGRTRMPSSDSFWSSPESTVWLGQCDSTIISLDFWTCECDFNVNTKRDRIYLPCTVTRPGYNIRIFFFEGGGVILNIFARVLWNVDPLGSC